MAHRWVLSALLLWGIVTNGLLAQDSGAKARDLFLESSSSAPAAQPPVQHLGLRYNLLLLDPATRRAREVDANAVFHAGDCFAVEFTSNRDGSLYAFDHGSSGNWQVLLPSPEMPDESSKVKAGERRRVPSDYCFRLDNPPGVERLILAVTERPEDVERVRSMLAANNHTGGSNELAAADVNSAGELVESWQRLASRDLEIEKIDQPASATERPHSVYAVSAAAAKSGHFTLEILVRHE